MSQTLNRYCETGTNSFGEPCISIPKVSMPDLRPYGWAPGGYMIRCEECEPELGGNKLRHFGDKRSTRCVTHALEQLAEHAARYRELRENKITAETYRVQRVTLEAIRDETEADGEWMRGMASTTLACLADPELGNAQPPHPPHPLTLPE